MSNICKTLQKQKTRIQALNRNKKAMSDCDVNSVVALSVLFTIFPSLKSDTACHRGRQTVINCDLLSVIHSLA